MIRKVDLRESSEQLNQSIRLDRVSGVARAISPSESNLGTVRVRWTCECAKAELRRPEGRAICPLHAALADVKVSARPDYQTAGAGGLRLPGERLTASPPAR